MEKNETSAPEVTGAAGNAPQDLPEEEKKKKGKKDRPKKSLGQEIMSWVFTLLGAVAIALLIRTFIFEPVMVDGQSMMDTLKDREVMFVTKMEYSSTWIFGNRLTFFGNPKRFDVVICRYPGRGNTNFVKRVVGLPGDTVELREGYLYVNGEKYDEPYISDEYRTGMGRTFGPYTVPDGMYFVMGDHRNNSNDSRSIGPISRDMIMGHVVYVFWPLNQWRGVPNGLDVK